MEDLVVLDGELVGAAEMGVGCIRAMLNSLGWLERVAELCIVIIALVAVVAQYNVFCKVCTIILATINYIVLIVIEFFNR